MTAPSTYQNPSISTSTPQAGPCLHCFHAHIRKAPESNVPSPSNSLIFVDELPQGARPVRGLNRSKRFKRGSFAASEPPADSRRRDILDLVPSDPLASSSLAIANVGPNHLPGSSPTPVGTTIPIRRDYGRHHERADSWGTDTVYTVVTVTGSETSTFTSSRVTTSSPDFVPTSTPASPSASASPSSPGSSNSTLPPPSTGNSWCPLGAENDKYPGGLGLTKPQEGTLWGIGIIMLSLLVGWRLILVSAILYPAKMLAIWISCVSQVVGAIFFLNPEHSRIEAIEVDPNLGGRVAYARRMIEEGGGILEEEAIEVAAPTELLPRIPLLFGYLGSTLVGGVFTFAAFNTMASKIASFPIGIFWLVILVFSKSISAKIITLGWIGMLVGFWFIDHAGMLRYYILVLGVLNSFFVLYDSIDDIVYGRHFHCIAWLCARAFGRPSASMWFLGWLFVSSIIFVGWVLGAIALWRQTSYGMFCQSQRFLAT